MFSSESPLRAREMRTVHISNAQTVSQIKRSIMLGMTTPTDDEDLLRDYTPILLTHKPYTRISRSKRNIQAGVFREMETASKCCQASESEQANGTELRSDTSPGVTV